jgi:hypothetical protein
MRITLAKISTSAVKDADTYDWFTVTKKFTLHRKDKETDFLPGSIVGLRESFDRKTHRLIDSLLGTTIVFTVEDDEMPFIEKRLKESKTGPVAELDMKPLLQLIYAKSDKLGMTRENADFLLSASLLVDPTRRDSRFEHKNKDKVVNAIEKLCNKERKVVKVKGTKGSKAVAMGESCFNKALKTFGLKSALSWGKEWDMSALMLNDLSSHIKLSIALTEDNARDIANYSSMDTSSRDSIPSTVWNYIEKVLEARRPNKRIK